MGKNRGKWTNFGLTWHTHFDRCVDETSEEARPTCVKLCAIHFSFSDHEAYERDIAKLLGAPDEVTNALLPVIDVLFSVMAEAYSLA